MIKSVRREDSFRFRGKEKILINICSSTARIKYDLVYRRQTTRESTLKGIFTKPKLNLNII